MSEATPIEDVGAEAEFADEGASAEATAPTSEDDLTPAQQERLKQTLHQAITQRDQQWQQQVQTQQQQVQAQQQQQPQPQPAPNPTDEVDSEIAALYTDDEVGRRTRQAVDKHISLMIKKLGVDPSNSLTVKDVQQIAAGESGRVRDQIRSGLTITQEVSELVARNVINDEDAAVVQQAYTQELQKPSMRAAADNPANSPFILKSVVYDLIKGKKIIPYARPKRPTNPLQPGGPGVTPLAEEPINPAASPFQSVRNMDKDQLAKVRNRSKNNYEAANRG
jgi:hypothetical protein